MLNINNLTKIYDSKTAVDKLTLEIKDGEIYGFIGHNGAGKTTTLKCIAGIINFDEGEILINGKSIISNPTECKKELAYLPDNPDLYEYMTGIQFLNFIADIFEIGNERKDKIIKYSELFEITDALNDSISTYSHGMKQKLAIISAFIHSPKIILMDEPFVGLDPKAAFKLKELMKEFCSEGNSILFSTHVLEVAEKLCSKIAIIKNGKLLVCGSMESVKGDISLEDVFLELTDTDKGDAEDA